MIVESPLMLLPPSPVSKEEAVKSSFFGVRNEAVIDATSSSVLVAIEVRGVSGVPSGSFKIAYSKGSSLKDYLRSLNLTHAASKNAVYDYSNLEHGRCRSTYVLSEKSRIVIGPPSYGPALQWQRSNHDSDQLMKNMGKGEKMFDSPM